MNELPRILLITPPLTQLNSPYPATMYLSGYLKSKGVDARQVDLGIKLINHLFSAQGLQRVFKELAGFSHHNDERLSHFLGLREQYIDTINPVVRFLKNKDSTIAYRIGHEKYLPQGPRFEGIDDLNWAFGEMGIIDKAKYVSTLYLEDLADLIRDYIAPGFGFAKYEEGLGLAANDFHLIQTYLDEPDNLIDEFILTLFVDAIGKFDPGIVGFTVPFPGCLYGALKCCQYLKEYQSNIVTVMGGGYVNTELREITNLEFFNYVDYLALDRGEAPLLKIIQKIAGVKPDSELIRTFSVSNRTVSYPDDNADLDLPFTIKDSIPDYTGINMDDYLSILEMINPMHRLWNDGKWNKLELSHGCYWGKCAFCDVRIEYIHNYEIQPAAVIVDKIEAVLKQTDQTGFHFVDEAAAPNVLKSLAIELLKRRVQITWWANIRFEAAFTEDLCRLLAESGCVAVTGGFETANDRLLNLMRKGISVPQVARVCSHFRDAGIMTHCYLMYGFPTQTRQETIDALEVVRQFFLLNLTQSAFWHRFALSAHSSVAQMPEKFGIEVVEPDIRNFAYNELPFIEINGFDHSEYTFALNKAVYNFMHGIGLEEEISYWFDNSHVTSSLPGNYISKLISAQKKKKGSVRQKRVLWIGGTVQAANTIKRGTSYPKKSEGELRSFGKAGVHTISADASLVKWLEKNLLNVSPLNSAKSVFGDFSDQLCLETGLDPGILLEGKVARRLNQAGLLIV